MIFGSIVKGEADKESNIDLLLLTANKLDSITRHKIADMVFEINPKSDTNFSTLVVDSQSWENEPISFLPIHAKIKSDGIVL